MGENAGSWAKLRQVVIASTHHQADILAVRQAFGLGEGFVDPELKNLALADATLPVSAERYLEIVGPTESGTPVGNWLAKVGDRAGFVLSVQVPDAAGVKERALAHGVRVPVDIQAFGKPVLQLHPKDVGVVLEIDGIPDAAEWFWNAIDPGPEPGAAISEIIGVEVPVADPEAMTDLWSDLLDIAESATANQLDLGGAWVRFTPGGPSSDWTIVLQRTDGNANAIDPELPGITFQLV